MSDYYWSKSYIQIIHDWKIFLTELNLGDLVRELIAVQHDDCHAYYCVVAQKFPEGRFDKFAQ